VTAMKKTACILAVLTAVFLGTSGAKALEDPARIEAVNSFSVGEVNIVLNEYELDENGEMIPYRNDKLVLPGECISKIAVIENHGADAWIRVRADFCSDEGMTGVDESMLILSEEPWEKRGDLWYYLPEPLPSGEEVTFLTAVRIPWEWTSEVSGRSFLIRITAEAVQVADGDPEFPQEEVIPSPAETGRDMFLIPLLGCILASLVILILLLAVGRRKKKDEA